MSKSRKDRKQEKKTQQNAGPKPGAPAQPTAISLPTPADKAESPRFGLIRLHFRSPLHLSNARPDDYGSSQRVLHSDALTAAIFQSWATLGHAEWIPGADAQGAATASPGFAVSSLFPFYGGAAEPLYFWPKPFFRNARNRNDETAPGEAKKYKKIKYVDTPHFEAYLHQSAPPEGGTENLRGEFQSANLPNLHADFITADVLPRIRKPRDESEPDIFYMERIYFRHNSGLWGLIRYDSDETRDRVKAALRLLGEQGLGTDRAVGNGQFEPEFDKLPLNVPTETDYAVNLSLFCPETHAQLSGMLDAAARYDLVKRGGWLSEPYNTYRKRSVQMFREGSLFAHRTEPLGSLGKMVDLQPEILAKAHPVWRDGRALWLPVNFTPEPA